MAGILRRKAAMREAVSIAAGIRLKRVGAAPFLIIVEDVELYVRRRHHDQRILLKLTKPPAAMMQT